MRCFLIAKLQMSRQREHQYSVRNNFQVSVNMVLAERADGLRTEDDLKSLVRKCTTVSYTQTERSGFQTHLVRYPTIEIVKTLGESLTADDVSVRRLGVSTLTWVIENSDSIDQSSIPHVLAFLCARLSDWASVEPAVQGIKAVYARHITDATKLHFPLDATYSDDRSQLSLFLGLPSVSSLPPGTSSLTEVVLTKLLIHVHSPSFGQAVRHHVLELFNIWITKYRSDLAGYFDILVKGLSIEGEDERDLSCLRVLFDCINNLFTSGTITSEISSVTSLKSVEDIFTCLTSYFPIRLVMTKSKVDDDYDKSLCELRSKMIIALKHFGQRSMEFLVPQLADPETSEDAYICLAEMGKVFPDDMIPFLLPELDNGGTLIHQLWKSILPLTNKSVVGEIVDRFIQKGATESLVLSSQSGKKIGGLILEKMIDNKFPDIVNVLTRVDGLTMSQEHAEVLVSILSNAVTVDDSIWIMVIPFIITDTSRTRVWSRVLNKAEIIVPMLRFHYSWTMDMLGDAQEYVTTNLSGSSILGQVLVELDHHDYPRLAIDVDKEWIENVIGFPRLYFKWFGIGGLKIKQIGKVVNELEREEAVNLVVGMVDDGQVEILAEIDPELVKRVLEEVGDLVKMVYDVIAIDDPDIASVAFGVIIGPVWGSIEEIEKIFATITSDKVWMAGINGLVVSVKDQSRIVRLIAHQLTCLKAELLVVNTLPEIKSMIPYILSLVDIQRTDLVIRLLCGLNSEDILEIINDNDEYKRVIIMTPRKDFYYFKLLIKYLILVNNKLSLSVVNNNFDQIISGIHDMILSPSAQSSPVIRFGAVQALAVMTEIVPVGKLVKHKGAVLKMLRELLDKEGKFVVRKQLAIAICNWINLD